MPTTSTYAAGLIPLQLSLAKRARRMEPITDHMRNVSLNHRAAETAMSTVNPEGSSASAAAAEGSERPDSTWSAGGGAGAEKAAGTGAAASSSDKVGRTMMGDGCVE